MLSLYVQAVWMCNIVQLRCWSYARSDLCASRLQGSPAILEKMFPVFVLMRVEDRQRPGQVDACVNASQEAGWTC